MIKIRQKGDFKKLTQYLEKANKTVRLVNLDKYGKEGVTALSSATPVDTGKTSRSWYYEIVRENGSIAIQFNN